ncbi:hypothetical protein BWQ96_10690 [Gracilariopsis chorda]|uniref:Nucleotide-diphospho-sugar transferase domain-containing protein n=1 Tax=Gracilariopsis chorda TaxID=448386 RepID=A0A2V3IC15_9FLOR|nr:hypothetical protein BWQ96_10714 [Gracilariopsis chorda]PXF39611.1 hypothetical protein BWQ96_10690 [Gracilariopsis chorda]|eukprot:PXF39588.1 hypothetical protein BWQ96_10714 [Gracilariopsis chorda]
MTPGNKRESSSLMETVHSRCIFLRDTFSSTPNQCTHTGRLAINGLHVSVVTLVVLTFINLLHFPSLLQQSSVLDDNTNEHVVDPISNITVRIAGQCRRPIVYVGVDTRRHLLHHYDLYAIPIQRYSPQKMNWARVAIIRFALQRCRQSSWVVYSDTDAYIHSRPVLETRLRKEVPRTMHVVYQHGMWSLNSGFHAWRMSKTSRNIAKQWNQRYKPTKSFFAEQKALLGVCEHKHPGKTTGRPNGFLGWHLKGNARYKTDISNLGRFSCRYEYVIRNTVFIVVAVAVVAYHCCTSTAKNMARGTFRFVTGFRAVFVLFLFALTLYLLTASFSRKLYNAASESRRNFTHLLPGGRVMVAGEICVTTLITA